MENVFIPGGGSEGGDACGGVGSLRGGGLKLEA